MQTKKLLLLFLLICANVLYAQDMRNKPSTANLFFYPQYLFVNNTKAEFFYLDTTETGFSVSLSYHKGTTNKDGEFNTKQLSWEFDRNPLRRNDAYSGFGISVGSVHVFHFTQKINYVRHSLTTNFYNEILNMSIYEFDYFPTIIDGVEYTTFDLLNQNGYINRSGVNMGYMCDLNYKDFIFNIKFTLGYQWSNISHSIKQYRNYKMSNEFFSPGYQGITSSTVLGFGYKFN